MNPSVGITHYWAQGDAVTHTVAYVLLLMSLVSWYFILSKSWRFWHLRHSSKALAAFWNAPTLTTAVADMRHLDREAIYTPLAMKAIEAATMSASDTTPASLNTTAEPGALLTRLLRNEIQRITFLLERGQTLLASVGATAPFIGLFGTVWGIYHALAAISGSGAVQIDKIAGPVGEALIMTAMGLLVAIPAVLAYNAFTRANRIILAELDGFAHDLYRQLTDNTHIEHS